MFDLSYTAGKLKSKEYTKFGMFDANMCKVTSDTVYEKYNVIKIARQTFSHYNIFIISYGLGREHISMSYYLSFISKICCIREKKSITR